MEPEIAVNVDDRNLPAPLIRSMDTPILTKTKDFQCNFSRVETQ